MFYLAFILGPKVAIEAGRQFDECYALAFAQQLKNKDIPEGGSKAVLLVNTTNSTVKHFVCRQTGTEREGEMERRERRQTDRLKQTGR